VRARVQQIIQTLPKVYAFSRVFYLLQDHGLKSKVAKTRQGTLDELGALLKRFGIGACEPSKAFSVIASAISDKDPNVRKSALATLRYVFIDIYSTDRSYPYLQRGICSRWRENMATSWPSLPQG
jgi:cytoskeleton-associated protein 5